MTQCSFFGEKSKEALSNAAVVDASGEVSFARTPAAREHERTAALWAIADQIQRLIEALPQAGQGL